MTKRLAVIDGKSVFYRGYYAMPFLSTKDGTPTGGVYGFAALALEMIKRLEPDYVAVAWDKPKTNIRSRKKIYPDYKAGRKPAPPDFYAQIPILHELLEAFGWPLYELDDYEADDIMGAFADQASKQGIETCLITSDLDALQLVGPLTHVYAMKKGLTNIEQFDVAYFEQKYGLKVHQFLDLKALKGDSSDNIPGVPGIGEKTATTLLKDYKTLDGVYEHLDDIKDALRTKLETGRESAYMSKKVAEIWCDAPVTLDLKKMDVHKFDSEALRTLLEKLEFRSLLRQLSDKLALSEKTNTSQASIFPTVETKKGSFSSLDTSKPTLIHLSQNGKEIWASQKSDVSFIIPTKDKAAQSFLGNARVIAADPKTLAHQLKKHSLSLSDNILHDIRQAAFLLDPLQRERSLEVLLPGFDLSSPGQVIAGLWDIYNRQMEAFETLPKLYKVAVELDFPMDPILFRMEHRGIILDTKVLARMSEDLGVELRKIEQTMYSMVGREFNIGSPMQLAVVLFEDLALPTQGIKKGKTGYSTGLKELEKLRGKHAIIELIEKFRELSKLKNTYVDALPGFIDKNSRLHTTYRQDVAATGRLSSADPNLQNIPIRTELGRKIRDAFVPVKGNVFVAADYSQFELRLAAVLAGDKDLINDFNGDVDIHTKTASDVFGVTQSEVTKNQRRAAKVINFGVLYGMSPHGLSAATGMNFVEAKRFIDDYFTLRQPIREYIDATLEKAKIEGYVETLFGRRRPTPDVKSNNFIVREAAKRVAANMPIQGTEADLMKMAMIKIEKNLGDLGEQVLQIHDSIVVECPKKNAEKVSELLQKTMENVYPSLGVRLKVDVKCGVNWGEA